MDTSTIFLILVAFVFRIIAFGLDANRIVDDVDREDLVGDDLFAEQASMRCHSMLYSPRGRGTRREGKDKDGE